MPGRFAIMRVLPNMKVIVPADYIEAKKATRAIAETYGPFYMRTSRAALPIITKQEDAFVIGKAIYCAAVMMPRYRLRGHGCRKFVCGRQIKA